ncbi:hypothetical protein QQS21_001967 [Conoideocrella luteorostrata]|uniref:Uncharacterized protein n=1 Tax=Conoideocrella luteorostrata TaxID=1105319 RepID=A0AAJ0CVZ5_9HYPO|nr:hypothetical protein QQS21_001967 [Conoideocrella luteorostrata]
MKSSPIISLLILAKLGISRPVIKEQDLYLRQPIIFPSGQPEVDEPPRGLEPESIFAQQNNLPPHGSFDQAPTPKDGYFDSNAHWVNQADVDAEQEEGARQQEEDQRKAEEESQRAQQQKEEQEKAGAIAHSSGIPQNFPGEGN